jgi:hypothetical protein
MKQYVTPEMDITLFETEDVITASGTSQDQLIGLPELGE